MKNFKKDLNAVSKEIKALQKKVDKLLVVVGKIEKPKVAKKSKTNVVKKNPVKKTVATKVVVKKPTAMKSTKTAVDTILGVIKRTKKGVDTAALMKKTGFNNKKIYNNIGKLKKQGKVKSVGKGVYLKA